MNSALKLLDKHKIKLLKIITDHTFEDGYDGRGNVEYCTQHRKIVVLLLEL